MTGRYGDTASAPLLQNCFVRFHHAIHLSKKKADRTFFPVSCLLLFPIQNSDILIFHFTIHSLIRAFQTRYPVLCDAHTAPYSAHCCAYTQRSSSLSDQLPHRFPYSLSSQTHQRMCFRSPGGSPALSSRQGHSHSRQDTVPQNLQLLIIQLIRPHQVDCLSSDQLLSLPYAAAGHHL